MMMKKEAVVVVGVVATVAAATAAVVLLRRWQRSSERRWRRTQRILRKFASQCAAPLPKLWQIADELVVDMKAGLSSDGRSKLPMLVSYVDSLPTGDEEGIYYGLNLSGTEFRVTRIQLGGMTARIVNQESKTVSIPSNLLVRDSNQELFDYIAREVAKFVSTESEKFPVLAQSQQKKLGFTYSFPVDEDKPSLESAIKWKKFSVDDTEGKAMVEEINNALEKHCIDMRVFAMVDDTVGNLVGDKYCNPDVVAAVTLAMGTNVAYVELKKDVLKWSDSSTKSGEMVIDVEWGCFNSSYLPITEFDVCLDAESSNPGEQIFEKLISGMYLGEIVRRVLLKMAKETALFGNIVVPPKLTTPYVLRSPDMAAMHQDTSEDRTVVDEKLKDIFEITNSTPMVREVVSDVCDIVVERAARLAGAGIVSILKKLERIETQQRSVVTVEGGLYQHYRLFRNYLHSCVWEMLGNSENLVIENSNGGSGIGAVFLAASNSNSSIQEDTPSS
ncbi:Hexokinase [Macleaya cordata]|uniref:Phosphotransferase n=1 Tax=Macleaya cordata TaxID=56857 RepID=A0A200Q151_MACCD|nr:Hexokinase [Macleaya cordata]